MKPARVKWLDGPTWRKCFAATFLCLIGCSMGTLGAGYYLADDNWLYALVVSFLAGLLASFTFIAMWNIAWRRMKIKEALKSSITMSLALMLIIITTENVVMYLMEQQHSIHGGRGNYPDDLLMMFIAMSLGFLLALPYNYYLLTKTGKACH